MSKNGPIPSAINYTAGDKQATKPVLHIKKQFFLLPGTKIRILDTNMRLVAKAYGLPFRLKEKIEIYSDEAMRYKIMTSHTTKILDWSVSFTLTQTNNKKPAGSLRRKGWSSEFVQDSWVIMNEDNEQIANVTEDSVQRGIIRRYILGRFLPQRYHLTTSAGHTLILQQQWNLFLLKYTCYSNQWKALKKELGEPILMGALSTIMVIEGRRT